MKQNCLLLKVDIAHKLQPLPDGPRIPHLYPPDGPRIPHLYPKSSRTKCLNLMEDPDILTQNIIQVLPIRVLVDTF